MKNSNRMSGSGSHSGVRAASVKAIIGAGFAMIGLSMAQSAFADRDSYREWHHRQVFGSTASPKTAMTAPHTVLSGRDASFQNWQHLQNVRRLRAQDADIPTDRAQGGDAQSVAIHR